MRTVALWSWISKVSATDKILWSGDIDWGSLIATESCQSYIVLKRPILLCICLFGWDRVTGQARHASGSELSSRQVYDGQTVSFSQDHRMACVGMHIFVKKWCPCRKRYNADKGKECSTQTLQAVREWLILFVYTKTVLVYTKMANPLNSWFFSCTLRKNMFMIGFKWMFLMVPSRGGHTHA